MLRQPADYTGTAWRACAGLREREGIMASRRRVRSRGSSPAHEAAAGRAWRSRRGVLAHLRARGVREARPRGRVRPRPGRRPPVRRRPGRVGTIAETDDGAVVGFALWFRTFSTFLGRPGIWLEDLFVRPEHPWAGRRARALLDHLRGLTDGRVEWAVLDVELAGDRVLRVARSRVGRSMDEVPVDEPEAVADTRPHGAAGSRSWPGPGSSPPGSSPSSRSPRR